MRLLGGLGLLAPVSLVAAWLAFPDVIDAWTGEGTRSVLAALVAGPVSSEPPATEHGSRRAGWRGSDEPGCGPPAGGRRRGRDNAHRCRLRLRRDRLCVLLRRN